MFSAILGVLLATAAGDGECQSSFANGEAVYGAFPPRRGLSELRIENGPSEHVLVKLQNIATGAEHLFFIESGATVTIKSITSGQYRLSFAVNGVLGDDCRTLVRARTVTRFSEPFVLERRELVTKTDLGEMTEATIQDGWVTLYHVGEGRAATHQISLSDFNR